MNLTYHQTERGFTLVELLVALTIMAILMVLLFAGFRFTTKVEDRVDHVLAKASDIGAAQRLIRELVHQSEDLVLRDNRGKLMHTFNGKQQEFSLISSLPENENHGGLYKFTFRIDDSGTDSQLTVAVLPYRIWEDWFSDETSDMAVLYREFTGGEFAYLYQDRNGNSRWQSFWDDSNEGLPRAIRINLVEDKSGQTHWPEQVMLTKVGAYTAAEVGR